MIIAKEMKFPSQVIHAITSKALMHDAEEAITGDLPAMVKRYVDWDPLVQKASEELFPSEATDPVNLDSIDQTVEFVHQQWQGAHNGGVAQRIVKAADLISALAYCKEEMAMGNKYFSQITKELVHCSIKVCEGHADLHKVVQGILAEMGFSISEGSPLREEISHL